MVQYTAARLKLAHSIQRTIESLQTKIDRLTGKLTKVIEGGSGAVAPKGKRRRRKMSAAARKKIAAAAKARWAKAKAAGRSRL